MDTEKTWNALKRGVAAAVQGASGPWEFEAVGRRIVCPHCSNTTFTDSSARLTSIMPIGFGNEFTTILTCSHCGRMEWFARAPERK